MARAADGCSQPLDPTFRTKSGLAVENEGTKFMVSTWCNCAKDCVY